MLRIASLVGFLILGGAIVAVADPQLGNSRDRSSMSNQIACGVERRAVKQLLDDDAKNVAFGQGIDSTVKRMGKLKRPDETGPRQKKERRVYRLWAIFDSIPPSETSPGVKLGYKTEDNDNDIHLAIRDSTGATMVVEFPHHSCTAGAQHRWDMETARGALVKSCSNKTPPRDPPQSFVGLHGSARITGVLFFDFAHNQRGRAPNVAELHPVLRITNLTCSRTTS
jgi:hypothetical protein